MKPTDINQFKVTKSKDLLLDIIKSPSKYKDNIKIVSSLKTQSDFSQLEIEEKNIAKCSLNTLKSSCELLLERGFKELDELRLTANNAITSADKPKKKNTKTKAGLQLKVNSLDDQINELRATNFLMQTIISELIEKLKEVSYESNEEKRIHIYKEVNRILEIKLSFTQNSKV